MAYNFLDLVNEVNRRLNEVELTSSNFSSAVGFYAHNKDAVNAAIRDINHIHHEWPFNHALAEETLTAGIIRYAFPTDANTIDFDTFRIEESTTFNNKTQKLTILAYEDYLSKYIDQEYTADTSKRDVPSFVFHAPSLEFGLVPAPKEAYTLYYEYSDGYNNPAILLDNQAMTNFTFLYDVLSLLVRLQCIIKKGYKDVFIDEQEVCLVEQTFAVYETGETQEVISYYKEQGV